MSASDVQRAEPPHSRESDGCCAASTAGGRPDCATVVATVVHRTATISAVRVIVHSDVRRADLAGRYPELTDQRYDAQAADRYEIGFERNALSMAMEKQWTHTCTMRTGK